MKIKNIDLLNTLILILIVASGFILRYQVLKYPIIVDEWTTYSTFLKGDFLNVFFYPHNNNHLLNTFFSWISINLLGDTLLSLRIPAFIASLCSVFFLFQLANKLNMSGIISALLMAVFPVIIFQENLCRGYAFVNLFAILIFLLGHDLIENYSLRRNIIVAFITALGVLSITTFLFPAGGLIFFLLHKIYITKEWKLLRIVLIYLFATVFFTLVMYLPVILLNDDFGKAVISNPFIDPLYWKLYIGLLPVNAKLTMIEFFKSVNSFLLIALLILFSVGIFQSWKNNRKLFFLVSSVLIASFLIITVKRVIPFPRNWLFILPFAFLIVEFGFLYTISKFHSRFENQIIAYSSLILLFSISYFIIRNETVYNYYHRYAFPDGPEIVNFLLPIMKSGDVYVADTPAIHTLEYYFGKNKFKNGDINTAKNIYYIIKPSRYSISNLSDLSENRLSLIWDKEDSKIYLRMQ